MNLKDRAEAIRRIAEQLEHQTDSPCPIATMQDTATRLAEEVDTMRIKLRALAQGMGSR